MKKTISLLLSLLLLMGLSLRMPQAATSTATEPADGSATEAIVAATQKMEALNSFHMDMDINLDMQMIIDMGDAKTAIPMQIQVPGHLDAFTKPFQGKFDLSMSVMGETMGALIYMAQEEGKTVLYLSTDEGVTWKKQINDNAELTSDPAAAVQKLVDPDLVQFERTGVEEIDGKPATVYTGKVDGQRLQALLESAGAAEELQEAMGDDVPADLLSNLGDMGLTFVIDDESGLPVRISIDMTSFLKELMGAAMAASMGEEATEGFEFEVSSAIVDCTLSQFDAVEPFAIPEAALNAPLATDED